MSVQWKKAVIHLECATDSDKAHNQLQQEIDLFFKKDNSELLDDKHSIASAPIGRDVRARGTAIFLSHKGKRYLLTARHVLYDSVSAKRRYSNEKMIIDSYPPEYREQVKAGLLNIIYNIIFRVPSYDEYLEGRRFDNMRSITCLNAGTPDIHAYTFSSPDLDLAIISLERRSKSFADELIKLGYEPIPSELIEGEPSREGAEVFTVGYPGATSLIEQINLEPGLHHWASSYLSLPVFSWGRVSMLHPQLPFYWCDMSIYPGNSGGPVIEDGRLVGIVSAQASLPIEGAPQVKTRIPFAKIIKAEFVKQLIEQQEEKDGRDAYYTDLSEGKHND